MIHTGEGNGAYRTMAGPGDGARMVRVPMADTNHEDAMLEQIDRDRGNHEDAAVAYLSRRGIGTVSAIITLELRLALLPALEAFIEHVVQLMTTASEDGGDTATRAYVALWSGVLKMRKAQDDVSLTMSVEAARALRSELRGYNERAGESALALPGLFAAVDTVLSRKERERRDADRRTGRNRR